MEYGESKAMLDPQREGTPKEIIIKKSKWTIQQLEKIYSLLHESLTSLAGEDPPMPTPAEKIIDELHDVYDNNSFLGQLNLDFNSIKHLIDDINNKIQRLSRLL